MKVRHPSSICCLPREQSMRVQKRVVRLSKTAVSDWVVFLSLSLLTPSFPRSNPSPPPSPPSLSFPIPHQRDPSTPISVRASASISESGHTANLTGHSSFTARQQSRPKRRRKREIFHRSTVELSRFLANASLLSLQLQHLANLWKIKLTFQVFYTWKVTETRVFNIIWLWPFLKNSQLRSGGLRL